MKAYTKRQQENENKKKTEMAIFTLRLLEVKNTIKWEKERKYNEMK